MEKQLLLRNVKISKKQKILSVLALSLLVTMILPLAAIESANAHSPTWTSISYAYIVAAPNPIGVGQTAAVMAWVDYPLPGATIDNNIRRINYTITITKPDGKIDTMYYNVVGDATGVQYFRYTPTQTGTYTLKFDYPGQIYTWNQANTPGLASSNAAYENDTITSASSTTTLSVQQDQVVAPVDSYPLPTEYWTYPIEGQNTYWYTVASNWLGRPYTRMASPGNHGKGGWQPDGAAPNSAHIMWTKPIQYGGVAGGSNTAILGEMFYPGLSYNGRFTNPIIMHGVLYYEEPWGNNAGGGGYVAVDLRTGQELWHINTTATGANLVPSFGYVYTLDTANQHGVLPNGLLVASTSVSGQGTVWRAYDARTGVLTSMNITNVPGGSNVAGPDGEYLKYILTNLGNTTNPKYYLMQWNSSKVFGGEAGTGVGTWYSGTANASLTTAYDWNVSIPSLTGTGWAVGGADNNVIPLVVPGDMLLLIQGTFGSHASMSATITAVVTTFPANITAVSLKPQTLGQVLWTKSYPQAPGNVTRTITDWDPSNGVFVFEDKETMVHYGYSLTDGNYLWGPTALTNDFSTNWNYFSLDSSGIFYGKLYFFGFSGILYSYDVKTGKLLWTYGNGGEGNSTLSGLVTPYGHYPIFISAAADGKLYLLTTEHSPNSPLYKGSLLRAIDANDGTELWTIMDYGNIMYGGVTPIADGYLTTLNTYDMQVYSYGKGPSQTSVHIQNDVLPLGSNVLIQGSVLDIAAGTKQNEQAARFPNGVPAVSDDSQSGWMEYVYMQKPKPTDVIGVKVQLTITNQNGNSYGASAVSDDQGNYAVAWTPPVTGVYKVIATFASTESYYGSTAGTSFDVIQASSSAPAVTPTPTLTPTAAPTSAPSATATPTTAPNPTSGIAIETYIAIAASVIIIAVAAAALVLRRRK